MERYLISVVLLSVCSLGFTRECRMDLQNNVDFPGSDVLQTYAADAEHCQQLCTDHHSCLFFSFLRPDWTRDNRHFYCYLKSTPSGEPKITTRPFGITSGYSLRSCKPELRGLYLPPVYHNVDFLGADYRSLFTISYEDCQRVCTEDPFCQFFTFVNGDYAGKNIRYKCHLKYSWTVPRPLVKAQANVVSGFSSNLKMPYSRFETACNEKLFPHVEVEGGIFEEVTAASDKHCQMLCTAHPRCTYFSFFSFKCHLKDNPHEMRMKAKSGVTSGIAGRGCQLDHSWAEAIFVDVDFYGADIRHIPVRNLKACQKACNQEKTCQFYAYLTEKYNDPAYRRRCHLKRTITIPSPPKVKKLQNVVSGFSLKKCIP